MEDDLKISIKEFMGDDTYINHLIILKAIESITVWGNNDFIWVGEYKGQEISVSLSRGDSGEFSRINKPDNLNITNEIIKEVNRVIRKLN